MAPTENRRMRHTEQKADGQASQVYSAAPLSSSSPLVRRTSSSPPPFRARGSCRTPRHTRGTTGACLSRPAATRSGASSGTCRTQAASPTGPWRNKGEGSGARTRDGTRRTACSRNKRPTRAPFCAEKKIPLFFFQQKKFRVFFLGKKIPSFFFYRGNLTSRAKRSARFPIAQNERKLHHGRT